MREYRIKEEKFLKDTMFYPQFRSPITVQDIFLFNWIREWSFFMKQGAYPEGFATFKEAEKRIEADYQEQRERNPEITYHQYIPKHYETI